MEFYKEINLPSWPLIQEFCRKKWHGKFTTSQTFTGGDLFFIGSLLSRDIKQELGLDVQIKTAIMFINEPRFLQDLHVDGFSVERINSSNTALNVPILNCDNGPMTWYDGKFNLTESPHNTIKYLKINWEEEPTIAEHKIINKPTIVKIDIPHHIENQSDEPRLMLSVRFKKDIPIG